MLDRSFRPLLSTLTFCFWQFLYAYILRTSLTHNINIEKNNTCSQINNICVISTLIKDKKMNNSLEVIGTLIFGLTSFAKNYECEGHHVVYRYRLLILIAV